MSIKQLNSAHQRCLFVCFVSLFFSLLVEFLNNSWHVRLILLLLL
ncbi:hypothetical protein HMPREF0454_04088 [Hafnia alvei ATCC 51873]|uniref:Uncharacterized protein n=1 Tax=Hafnia alvei ATCC 51873 TaxID=1002364 RepID=G9YBQ9_HAFAL|nr:hypothetical protein HMPREF0454_04088 [Hafnia alvei ATCC 51873]